MSEARLSREFERILSGDPGCIGEPGRKPKRRSARAGAFTWTRQRTRAAELVSWLGVVDTAAAVGVSRRTLSRWLNQVPEFRVRVAELAEAPDEDEDEDDSEE